MKIECITERLKDGVIKVFPFTSKQTSLPNLQGIFLSAIDSSLILRATNLESGIEVEIPVKVETPGSILVPGDIILKLFSNLSIYDKKTTLFYENSYLTITTGGNVIKVNCLPLDGFPNIPKTEGDRVVVDSNKIIEGINSVIYSASNSSIKPEIAGIYIYNTPTDLVFVATDTFRLAEKKIRYKTNSVINIIIPIKNVNNIIKAIGGIDGDLVVIFSKNSISFSTDEMCVTSRLIDGVFPNYKQIIPKETTTEFSVLKQDLISTFKLTGVFADKFNQITIIIDDKKKKVIISTQNQLIGDSSQEIDATIIGDPITIHCNYRYIQEVLSVLYKESVSVQCTTNNKPIIVRSVSDDSFLYLVMPLNR